MSRKNEYYAEEVSVPLYESKVLIIFSDHHYKTMVKEKIFDEFKDQCHDGDAKEAQEYIDQGEAMVFRMNKSRKFLMIFKNNVSVGIIAHEAYHLAMMIGNRIGMPYCSETEEAFAYLIEWIVDKVIEISSSCKK